MDIQAIKRRYGIIGRSPMLDQALDTALRVAGTDLTVLLSGESGVGKEVFSRIIHSQSSRKHHPFIAVNCGAIPVGTINSELFGHEKGAFTGATADRKGYFETVDKGTIFLDEISEMPADTQAYLLRVLESGEFIRVGSSVIRKTDVRVVAASNVDLYEQVKKGKFRQDLYYRLNTVPIKIPALKERREDIQLLFRKFVADFADKYRTTPISLDDQAKSLITNYAWPGNVRELKNMAEQLSVLSQDRIITAGDILSIQPEITRQNLPAFRKDESSFMHERDILYKVLFDMKKDMSELKRLVVELVRANNLQMPELSKLSLLEPAIADEFAPTVNYPTISKPTTVEQEAPTSQWKHPEPSSVIVDSPTKDVFQNSEIIEESLSLEQMEKDYISKALDKYGGRRKDAAEELGISERTLYRKIKQYGLE